MKILMTEMKIILLKRVFAQSATSCGSTSNMIYSSIGAFLDIYEDSSVENGDSAMYNEDSSLEK